MALDLDDVIFELYRLAETREWDGAKTEEALAVAIEGMEQIWELRQADKRKTAMVKANKKQPRIWC
jgi:predicted house-cleaning noncanonical NTP pyrophosphatase (MazG superfamily)